MVKNLKTSTNLRKTSVPQSPPLFLRATNFTVLLWIYFYFFFFNYRYIHYYSVLVSDVQPSA